MIYNILTISPSLDRHRKEAQEQGNALKQASLTASGRKFKLNKQAESQAAVNKVQ